MQIEPATGEYELQQRYWRLAAVLFVGGGLAAFPADALHRPAHEPTIYLLPLLAIVSGALCWAIADRAPRRWLHVMMVIATVEIALTCWLADDIFAIYYVFIAIYAAYVFQDRRAIAAQIAVACLSILAPIAYDPDDAREHVILAFTLIPTVMIAAGVVAYLRERLEASEARFRQLAERDPLTGVGNYRLLSERFPAEIQRHELRRHPLALIVIDMDDFKRINDEHGHQYGDRVLQEVAGALMGSVRSSDIVVRHGGDEFSVVCPETGEASAGELAERLQQAIAKLTVEGRPLGATTGHAVYPQDAESLNTLLAHADEVLRASKDPRGR
ncbi:MAG: GGDEF domain-containing protein [Solirubrobacterales bacterium]|nr:GGDEF domain-containing protein [Solirubrobacterales bacterium]